MIFPHRGTVLALLLTACTAPLAGAQAPSAPTRLEGRQLYQRTAQGTAWVVLEGQTGSGWLVDAGQRLVVTNDHVVRSFRTESVVDSVLVVLPLREDGQFLTDKDYYRRNLRRLAIRGRVLGSDRRRDLALIQLETLPGGVTALPLATESPSPGDTVHSVGNPGASDQLWVYTSGTVRSIGLKSWRTRAGTHEAKVVQTQAPLNPGDSGGPVVNDQGQVIGVAQGGHAEAKLFSYCIAVSEVRAFLATAPGGVQVRPQTARPLEKRAVLKDDGGFFSEETRRKALEQMRTLVQKYDCDVALETFAGPPADQAEKVKAMSAAERSQFVRTWARERAAALEVQGIYLLVSRSPSAVHLVIAPRFEQKVFGKEAGAKLSALLVTEFKARRFDAGLLAFLQGVQDRLAATASAEGPARPRTDRPLEKRAVLSDDGGFFSEETRRKALEQMRTIVQKYDCDVVLETFAGPPADRADKVKAMSAAERTQFFQNWARERAAANQVDGIYLLVSRSPSKVHLHVTPRFDKVLSREVQTQLGEALVKEFRARHFDEGLQAFLKGVQEKLARSP